MTAALPDADPAGHAAPPSRWAAPATPRTWPPRWPSWPRRRPGTSPARSSAWTAAWECEEERIRWKNAELLSPAWAPSTLWATISPRAGRLSRDGGVRHRAHHPVRFVRTEGPPGRRGQGLGTPPLSSTSGKCGTWPATASLPWPPPRKPWPTAAWTWKPSIMNAAASSSPAASAASPPPRASRPAACRRASTRLRPSTSPPASPTWPPARSPSPLASRGCAPAL